MLQASIYAQRRNRETFTDLERGSGRNKQSAAIDAFVQVFGARTIVRASASCLDLRWNERNLDGTIPASGVGNQINTVMYVGTPKGGDRKIEVILQHGTYDVIKLPEGERVEAHPIIYLDFKYGSGAAELILGETLRKDEAVPFNTFSPLDDSPIRRFVPASGSDGLQGVAIKRPPGTKKWEIDAPPSLSELIASMYLGISYAMRSLQGGVLH